MPVRPLRYTGVVFCRLVPLVIVAVLAMSAPVLAFQSTPSQAAYESGLAAYRASDFVNALLELERAYALDPRPDILFARAQTLRRLGRCQAAQGLFDQFIATSPSARQHEAARLAMTRCLETPVPPPAPVPDPPPVPRATAPPVLTPLRVVPPPPPAAVAQKMPLPSPPITWLHDKLAPGLLLGGLALGTVGIFSIASARSLDVDARRSDDYQQYQSGRAAAERRQRWGLAATMAGTALAVAGFGRYLHLAIEDRGAVVMTGARF